MQQPFLTHHSAVLAAPVQAWSALDGQADGLVAERTVEGVYCADSRVVSQLEVTSPSHALEHIGTDERGGARAAFQYVLRTPELGVDPALLLNRVRQVDGTGISEHYELSTASLESLDVDLRVRLRPDATAMQEIKSGLHGQDVAAMLTDRGATFPWRDEKTTAT